MRLSWSFFCPLLSAVPPNHSLQSSPEILESCPMSSQPFILTSTPPKEISGRQIPLISSVRAFPCSTGSVTDITSAPRILATLFRNKGYHVHLLLIAVCDWAPGVRLFPLLILDKKLEKSFFQSRAWNWAKPESLPLSFYAACWCMWKDKWQEIKVQ